MCFGPLDGVEHTLPAVQKDKRAGHGGYTTNEIAGGYVGHDCCLGCPIGIVVKEISNDPDAVTIQAKQVNTFVLNILANAICGYHLWTLNSMPTTIKRNPKKPNTFLLYTFSGDKGKPPTEVRQVGGCCLPVFKRSDWSKPGGICNNDPDFPCAPKSSIMFRDSPEDAVQGGKKEKKKKKHKQDGVSV